MLEIVGLTTSGCHLCDQAAALFQTLMEHNPESRKWVRLTWKDIAVETQYLDTYATRIPVLGIETEGQNRLQHELCWPFDEAALAHWLNQRLSTEN